jgi:myo-inositol-1(or 4)-monophosphatase
MHALLNVAVMAVHRAGDSLIRNLNKLEKIKSKVTLKGRNDFVSEADVVAEKIAIETILRHYPDHAILAEESGQQGESDYLWIIDPLDGTTNFLHGFPNFCVSIALMHEKKLVHAAVYDPIRQELFTASEGQGAQLDGRKIRVSGEKNINRALIGTGFPYRDSNKAMQPYMNMLQIAIEETAGVRRPGAAALDLCYVAAGRLDAFWETGLSIWDIAGGALIIQEAGGIISGLDGSDKFLEQGHVLTGSPRIHSALTDLFAKETEIMFK